MTTTPEREAERRAQAALASLELVGDGEWTPQDHHCAQVARDVLALVERVEKDREWRREFLERAEAAEARAARMEEALRELVRTSARQLNPTLATQAEWEAAERNARAALSTTDHEEPTP
jgi:hypothetical protein